MATTSAQVQQLYVAYLGRAADKAGLDYWLDELNASPATLTLENLRANFVNEQPEYTDAYAGLTRSETVSKIYLNLFGRPADAAGLTYWTTGAGASVSADQLLVAFINGAAAADAAVVTNKVLVSEVYTSTAGANYSQADATTIIADVDATPASITAALALLSDGSLSGIAVPTGVSILKAAAVADAAVISYEASKVDSLTALNDKVVALNADYGVTLAAIADGIDTGSVAGDSYNEVVVAIQNAKDLRAEIGNGASTDQLKLDASVDVTAVATARADLINTSSTAVADINAYNAAVTANAALTAPSDDQVDTDTGALQGIIAATTANGAAFVAASDAYVAATGNAAITTADQLYTAITTANAATLAKIDAAFNTGVFATTYAAVKADGVAQAAKTAAEATLTAAENKIGGANGAYVTAAEASAASAKVVADAQAADALVAEANAETTAHTAVTDAADNAGDAVTAITTGPNAYAVDATATITTLAGTAKADLFFFTNTTHVNDFSITDFNKGDAIYVGEGYTFASNVTTGTDGFYVGTNASVKEVFFTQNATTGVVSAVIEGNATGNISGTTGSDNVTVITLSGITSLTDVSYANGVITSAHVA
jgi:hypothetical protein